MYDLHHLHDLDHVAERQPFDLHDVACVLGWICTIRILHNISELHILRFIGSIFSRSLAVRECTTVSTDSVVVAASLGTRQCDNPLGGRRPTKLKVSLHSVNMTPSTSSLEAKTPLIEKHNRSLQTNSVFDVH